MRDDLPPDLEAAFAQAGVKTEHQSQLAHLAQAWPWPGPLTARERVARVVQEYEHWLLFVRSRDGDAVAAESFQQHWRRAARAFLGRGFSRDDVDELAASFFERTYRAAPRFVWKTPFTAFLHTVLLNLARDAARQRRRAAGRVVPLADEDEAALPPNDASSQRSPERILLGTEEGLRVTAALSKLPPLDRHLVKEVLAEGRPVGEVALELGITRTAAYQRLYRSRKLLRTWLLDGARSRGGRPSGPRERG